MKAYVREALDNARPLLKRAGKYQTTESQRRKRAATITRLTECYRAVMIIKLLEEARDRHEVVKAFNLECGLLRYTTGELETEFFLWDADAENPASYSAWFSGRKRA